MKVQAARLKGCHTCCVPWRADVRPLLMHHAAQSPASQQRTRWLSLWSRPRPPPGCILPSPCSLLSSTSLPRSEHTHSCLLRSAAPSLLPRLWSPLLQEGVCAPSALSAPTSVKLLSSALRPRSLLSSLCLPQLQLFDCQVFFQS